MPRKSADNTVTGMLTAQSERVPGNTAIIYTDASVSYAELDLLSRRAAAQLEGLGVREGDRVAIWLPNCTAYLVIYLACTRLGAIAVAVNTRYRAVEVADIIARSGASILVCWPGFRGIDFLGILQSIDPDHLAGLDHVIIYDEGAEPDQLPASLSHCESHSYHALVSNGVEPMLNDNASPDAGCNIFMTSGTTKAPKFVLHAQRSIVSHAHNVSGHLLSSLEEGTQLQVLPLCGVFGFTQAMASIAAGQTIVMMSAFDPTIAISLIDTYRVRYLNATDDMIEALLKTDNRVPALPGIEYCGFGAFNADPEIVIRKAEAQGLTLVGLYGMSEVQALFAMQSPDMPVEQRMLGGGQLVSAAAEVRVRNIETGAIQPHGEQGELEIRGPGMFKEYYADPAATAEAITEDGFLRTGDMGYTTGERSFTFLSRMGDVLRLGGFLVSPLEIETFIQELETILGCQVVATSVEGKMRPVAFVTLTAGNQFDESDIIQRCREGLAGYKTPHRIFQLDEFPVTLSANGTKIQRAMLRQWAEDWT